MTENPNWGRRDGYIAAISASKLGLGGCWSLKYAIIYKYRNCGHCNIIIGDMNGN